MDWPEEPEASARVWGDWGSTRFRVWLDLPGWDQVMPWDGGAGIGLLERPARDVLRDLLAGLPFDNRAASVVLCGMAGARGGLHEAPYVECPVDAASWARSAARLSVDGVPVAIAAGAATPAASKRAEVMRGEETQVFGAMSVRPDLTVGSHLIVLPGTHSKWVRVEDGAIVDFATAFTGELHAALLKSSLTALEGMSGEADEWAGINDAVAETLGGAALVGTLFQARSRQLRQGRSPDWAKGFVSGLLISQEIAEMLPRFGHPARIVIVGEPGLALRYIATCRGFAVDCEPLLPIDCTLAGLRMIDAHA